MLFHEESKRLKHGEELTISTVWTCCHKTLGSPFHQSCCYQVGCKDLESVILLHLKERTFSTNFHNPFKVKNPPERGSENQELKPFSEPIGILTVLIRPNPFHCIQ